MKKARANTNDYWDKKLLEVEEKDPNRWRHTGYKKMYIEGESSSESDREFNFDFIVLPHRKMWSRQIYVYQSDSVWSFLFFFNEFIRKWPDWFAWFILRKSEKKKREKWSEN